MLKFANVYTVKKHMLIVEKLLKKTGSIFFKDIYFFTAFSSFREPLLLCYLPYF